MRKAQKKRLYTRPCIKITVIKLNHFYTFDQRDIDSMDSLSGINLLASGGCGCGSSKTKEIAI